MFTVQEFNPQMLEVFCPNKRCSVERLSALKRVTVMERVHRQMIYAGSMSIGWSDRLFNFMNEYHFPETGTYHFYSCPVCGGESIYLEKWGIIKRSYCG